MDIIENRGQGSIEERRKAFMDNALLAIKSEKQVVCDVRNYFTGKQYIRETDVPKGVVLISEIHLTDHPFMCLMGEMIVINQLTGECTKIKKDQSGVTKTGTRRLVLALDDVTFSTYHPTAETDIDRIGDQILAYDPESTRQWARGENKKVYDLICNELKIRRLL